MIQEFALNKELRNIGLKKKSIIIECINDEDAPKSGGFPEAYIHSFLLNPRCIINESWTYCVLAFRVLMPKKNCVFIYIQRFNRRQVHLIFTGP